MQIPRRVDYGLRAVIYLSVRGEKCCSITEIAKQQEVPQKFLEKIIQDLMRCGLIKSKRGACGGYTLARSPEQISFYDVIEAIEGPPTAVKRTNRNRRMPMKHFSYLFVLLLLSTLALTGCEAIGDIFKAGVWTGVLLVILVVGVIVWLVTKSKA
jgi:Rrf2 family transcriptional regulator, iron-sulfur cluster assembly transcription factor